MLAMAIVSAMGMLVVVVVVVVVVGERLHVLMPLSVGRRSGLTVES